MAKRALTPAIIPKTYAELRDAVLAVVRKGRREIERAWVESYHEIGRLIHVYSLQEKERAAYGAGVFSELAKDSGISSRTLHECVQFYRRIPIVRRGAQFNWAKFRVFCQVEDDSQRLALMTDAAKNAWTTDQLIDRVRALNATLAIESGDGSNSATPTANLLKSNRGTPGVYRVAKVEGALVVDLGFACYFDLSEEQADGVKEGDLVQLDGNGRISAAEGATKADLFNYRVEIIKVVDGDTLWVKIYLRPRQWLKQKLRLRGLDCPEMKTPEGKAAKRFVDALVAKTTAVIINTTKSDKYDRYLADVFLEGDFTQLSALNSQLAVDGGLFLNNALLENGQAVRKDEWEFGDWDSYFAKAT